MTSQEQNLHCCAYHANASSMRARAIALDLFWRVWLEKGPEEFERRLWDHEQTPRDPDDEKRLQNPEQQLKDVVH
jgi:hypothetical protein